MSKWDWVSVAINGLAVVLYGFVVWLGSSPPSPFLSTIVLLNAMVLGAYLERPADRR